MHCKINTDDFQVTGKERIKLNDHPTKIEDVYQDKSDYKELINEFQDEINDLQRMMYAHDCYSMLLIFHAMDAAGNIGIGYSFGGKSDFPGQRFAGRLANDPLGMLTQREVVLVEGAAAQTDTLRWEDYTQTAIDPVDDETIWYVGDYFKEGASSYSTRIGAFRLAD